MIAAIVGSREYRPVRLIDLILDRLEAEHPDGFSVLSGGEPTGVDDVVKERCVARGYHQCMCDPLDPNGIEHLALKRHFVEFLPADRTARAKFARNSKVVQHSSRVIALFDPAKPKSPGTSDTVAKARREGLPVFVHHHGWEA